MSFNCRICKAHNSVEANYCEHCGSRTARLIDVTNPVQSFLTVGGALSVECLLKNEGISSASIRSCTFDCQALGILGQKASPALYAGVQPGDTVRFTADLGQCPADESSFSVIFHLVSDDGERGEYPDWNVELLRTLDVDVRVKVAKPGDIEFYPEVVFLSGEVTSAEITAVNHGGNDAVISHVVSPPRLRVLDGKRQPIGDSFTVPSRSSAKIILETAEVASMRDQSVGFQIKGGRRKNLPILVPRSIRASFRPTYVVGIDFGTANTSIAVRQVLTNNTGFVPGREGGTRFPSSMYVSYEENGGGLQFGAAAERYDEAMTSLGRDEGIFVKELKTSLREDNDRFAEMSGGRFTKRKLLRIYFCELKSLIDDYFQETFGFGPEQTDVLYYVALPVLDKEQERYRKQLHETQIAVEGDPEVAGDRGPFPKGNVEYVSEPGSAALYCFTQLRQAGAFNELRNTLCVFDSGGGTTDTCIMQIDYGGGGEPEFTVLGTGCAEIGGWELTRQMISYLGEHKKDAWKDIARGMVSTRMDVYISELKGALTRALDKARKEKRATDIAELEGVSVLLAEIFAKGGDESFSKADQDKVVRGLLPELRRCLQNAHTEAGSALPHPPHYVLAVGGNSLVAKIREDIYDRYHGDGHLGVLPRLTNNSHGEDLTKLDRVLIGDQQESRILMEAVASGSVMWYGASLVKHVPFDIVLRTDGTSRTIVRAKSIFRTGKWNVGVDQMRSTECEMLIQSTRLPDNMKGECRLARFTLPPTPAGAYDIDVTLDKKVLVVSYERADGVRQHIGEVRLDGAMDVMGQIET